jgi:flagellar biosynthesis protein FlhA
MTPKSPLMQKLVGQTDLLAALVVVLIVTMLVIPLPAPLLDLFITLNISCGLAIVIATLYLNRALDFASFPSLLLLTTMFRQAINVSVTRLILTRGDAGNVVAAFGHFLIGGDYAVGLFVFGILMIINLVVITKGAGRVSEVSARFTLDALPGKQMAIDADLNAGLLTPEEAKARRQEVATEADF